MPPSSPAPLDDVPVSRILASWWPLAASWLLMAAESPALTAVVARLPDPEIHLAAYGGVVFPISLIIEAPVIMLLAASTALCRDWNSYIKIRRFMMAAGAFLTSVHILLAFTPLYDWITVSLLSVPAEIIEPARLGLKIMTPWTWSIAYRRFHQGVMIRFGYSRLVGYGTVLRLSTILMVLLAGYQSHRLPGIAVGSSAIAAGVIAEAIYAGFAIRPILRDDLVSAKSLPERLTLRIFLAFYAPLVMTSLLSLLANPLGSAAISRLPMALSSLAAWPVVSGLIFLLRSAGLALNEVVVALLDEKCSSRNLIRFTSWLSAGTTIMLLIILLSPLALLWFEKVSALSPALASLATRATWLALPLPALSVLQSWFQGAILHGKRTGGISESVVIYLAVSGLALGGGVLYGKIPGLYIGVAAITLSTLAQTAWLGVRSCGIIHQVRRRDADCGVP